eukprot:gene28941-34930_t
MLWNATATEALPIFLSALVPEYVAIIISVTLVLMFGEIIPASILTGPKQLQIAATLTPMVYVVLFLFLPIAYPIAKLLDYIIGHDEGLTMYSRRELATMMVMQHEEGQRRASISGPNTHDTMQHEEVVIIGGALKYRDMKVSDVMTPSSECFMISIRSKLSYKTMYEIFKSGYSRIPVYDRDLNDIVGLVLAKDLIFVDPEDEIPVENFIGVFGRKPMVVWHDQKLGETLQMFRQERAHMAIVRDVRSEGDGDPYYIVTGIITLEDIVEEILGQEIEDETDRPSAQVSSVLRDMDLARFKTLRTSPAHMKTEVLTPPEVQAVVQFLQRNVPEVQELISAGRLSKNGQILDVGVNTNMPTGEPANALSANHIPLLEKFVQHAEVFTLQRKTPLVLSSTAMTVNPLITNPHPDDILYKRHKVSNTCILILQGRVRVVRGEYGDSVVVGAWCILAAPSLIQPEGTYAPDFTAYIESELVRIVRFSAYSNNSHSVHREGWSTLSDRRGKVNPLSPMSATGDGFHDVKGSAKSADSKKGGVHWGEIEQSSESGSKKSIDGGAAYSLVSKHAD